MKSLVMHEVKAPLRMEEWDDPKPGAGEVVIQLKAAALNRRDYWITQGMYPGIKTPVILGSDGAGVVAVLGDDVSADWHKREVIINPGLEWGDDNDAQSEQFHILGMPKNGTFSTHVCVPVSILHAKPETLDWNQAAALPLAGVTAYRALCTQGKLCSQENVLITGVGGGVATFALQFAISAGAKVFVTSSSPQKIQSAKTFGAVAGFNYKEEDWVDQAKSASGGGFDLIIDSAGGAGYKALLELAKPGGRIVNYGATAGPPPKLDLFKVFWKQLQLIGTTMGSPEDFERMVQYVEDHQVLPIIDEIYSLEKGDEAVKRMENAPQFGKTVLRIDS